jgi:membrane protease YdiL (CAAX protease family)
LGVLRAGHIRAGIAPNRMAMYLTTMIFEWVLFVLIYVGLRLRAVPMREIIGPKWSSFKAVMLDVGVACVFWVSALIILTVAGRLLRITPEAQRSIVFLLPQTGAEIFMWILLSTTAGICEETIFRGYLQRQFISWSRSPVAGVILSAAVFGAAHSYQGGRQPFLIGIFGALFGILAVMRRSTKPGMIAHALQDSVSGIAASLYFRLRH